MDGTHGQYAQPSGWQDPGSIWTDARHYELYLALLGLAESFRSQGQPEAAYTCLVAITGLAVPYNINARIHCEIGKLLLRQSSSVDVAKQYLSQAAQPSSALENIKLDAASCLAELCILQGNTQQARNILHGAIEQSQHSPYWQCNFILQLAKVFLHGQDFTVASQIIALGESFSLRHQAQYLNILFQLTRAQLSLRQKQIQTASVLLTEIQTSLSNPALVVSPLQREELRFYQLSLDCLWRLALGKVKSVRPYIQSLQTTLETMGQLRTAASSNPFTFHPLEKFCFVPADIFPALTFALSAQFFGMIGHHDKLDRLFQRSVPYLNSLDALQQTPLQSALRTAMYQQVIPASLTSGRSNQALNEVSQYVTACAKDPKLLAAHKGQIHVLLGLCAMQFGYLEVAESQLNMAYRSSSSNEMLISVNLNLAMLYFRAQRFQDLLVVAQRIRPEVVTTENAGLRCAVAVLQGFVAFIERRGMDAKMLLRNSLQISNEEDLNQLMAVSLMLMAKNCSALGEYHDVVKVAKTAYDLAEKIPDQTIQMSALTSLSEVYGMLGDFASQSSAVAILNRFTQKDNQEMLLVQQSPNLNILQWTEETVSR
ncbi:hypothetical protein RvY_11522 [Ramazzottius varieornatus]|uniref:MAU2 chromatid cohesion factor homolog n=1 Tax=Ramazzottius varieornatus TaxID=947166 RepID=A0A1D1VKQ6_RAMVA|nr:hypothetical protein RvY_11522 [Ramazzottius varieornatus]